MVSPIHLDLRVMLPIINDHFERGLLQRQQPRHQHRGLCSYGGLCAIGCTLQPEERVMLDDVTQCTEIGHWLSVGVVTCPDGQRGDIIALQVAHDEPSSTYFNRLLDSLTREYLPC